MIYPKNYLLNLNYWMNLFHTRGSLSHTTTEKFNWEMLPHGSSQDAIW